MNTIDSGPLGSRGGAKVEGVEDVAVSSDIDFKLLGN